MDTSLIFVSLVQSMAISLGVGASTLAIVNFFVALKDGTIDQTERHMMGAVYVVLRVAMVVILAATLLLFMVDYTEGGMPMTTYLAQGTLIAVLYLNAVLMTAKIMPVTIGPALQAATWYSLGIVAALVSLGFTAFGYLQFGLGYLTVILLAVSVVNGIMAHQKAKRAAAAPKAE